MIKITLSEEATKKFLEHVQIGRGFCGHCGKELVDNNDHFKSCTKYHIHYKREELAQLVNRRLSTWRKMPSVRINKMIETFLEMNKLYVSIQITITELKTIYTDKWHTETQVKRFSKIQEKVLEQFNRLDQAQQRMGGAPFNITTGIQS